MNLISTKSFRLSIYAKGDPSAKKLALVLPGKLDSKDYLHMTSHVDMLSAMGFYALSFDPPGSWESPGDITLYTVTNYIISVHEIIEYYGNRPTLLIGHSLGSAVATLAHAANPNVFAFVSLMTPIGKDGFSNKADPEWESTGFKISKRALPPGDGPKIKEFKLPYTFYLDKNNFKLTAEILHSTKPKLFVLGKEDALIPSDRIRQTFKLFAEPKELYELDWGHSYRRNLKKIKEVNEVIKRFLIKYKQQ